MELIGFLICFPLIVALLLFVINNNVARKIITIVGGIVIGVASCVLCVTYLGTSGVYFNISSEIFDGIAIIIDLAITAVVIGFGLKYKNVLALVFAAIQLVLTLVFAFGGVTEGVEVQQGLYVDSLSVLMTFIIGVIGSGICIYALGYMDDHHEHHTDIKDRRSFFFGIMFLFLSAMFLIVFANNMDWLFTAWEVTTLCSFLLIGYDQTEIAIANSFRQIIMNMVGGIAFAVALIYCAAFLGTLSLNQFIAIGQFYSGLVLVPLVCLSLAGMTKAAQMPFHSWLLGAMVAPTPTSALLHSSTMVKAGVFLLVKLAPLYAASFVASTMVILVGGVTFCLCSFLAISQTNAKRVLAYSTIANLGLIVACAGIGTAEAVWAACFLIMFHAAAKSLLFLCVGTAEHHIGSRDIEDMDLLFERMPKLARFMMLGIMVMFIAPFGMLIAKWGVLVSILYASLPNIIFLALLAFGSAATFMFWAKWLGKLSGIAGTQKDIEWACHPSEWFAQGIMVVLCVLGCVLMPLVSDAVVCPYLYSTFGTYGAAISSDNLWIAAICSVFIIVVLFGALNKGAKAKKVDIYLSGVSVDNAERMFRNSLTGSTEATARNWYMDNWFGESRLTMPGNVVSTAIIVLGFAMAILGMFGFVL